MCIMDDNEDNDDIILGYGPSSVKQTAEYRGKRARRSHRILSRMGQSQREASVSKVVEDVRCDEWTKISYTRGRRGNMRGGRGALRSQGRKSFQSELDYNQLSCLQNKSPAEVIMILSQNSGLNLLLNRNKMNSSLTYLLVRVLGLVCSCTSAPGTVDEILLSLMQSKFTHHVALVLQQLCANPFENQIVNKQFIKDLLHICFSLFQRFPSPFHEGDTPLLKDVLFNSIDQLADIGSNAIDKDIINRKEIMFHNSEMNRDECKMIPTGAKFRDLSIFPNTLDIHPDTETLLRNNISVGAFRTLNHYLDVHFRLMREDFICPLREGIANFLKPERGCRVKDIYTYHKVHLMRTVCSEGGLLHRISFDVNRLYHVQWETSKKLLYGSLVCLSKDNFQTLFFATVVERNIEKLQNGIIDILFENSTSLEDIGMDAEFVMVESPAYFEAYKHVLKALQMIRPGDLPFENYIVSCCSNVKRPKYLSSASTYDFTPLIEEDMILSNVLVYGRKKSTCKVHAKYKCGRDVKILNEQDWPTADEMHVDHSQFRALRTALLKEFVLIQGPPGTGKTYIGLKIVKMLLHNYNIWNVHKNSPMLIVCYTNHALDQFLEGIYSFCKEDVIRVGGRMQSKILAKLSLKTLRQKARLKMKSQQTDKIRLRIRQEMMNLKWAIEKIGLQIEASETDILHEDVLCPFMGKCYDNMIMTWQMMLMEIQTREFQGVHFQHSVILMWLGLGNLDDMIFVAQQSVPYNRHEYEEIDSKDIQIEADVIQDNRKIEDADDIMDKELYQIQKMIDNLQYEKQEYIALDVTNLDKDSMLTDQNAIVSQLTSDVTVKLKYCLLQRLGCEKVMSSEEVLSVVDVWNLSLDDRWRLYRHWRSAFRQKLTTEVKANEVRYQSLVVQYKETLMMEDREILSKARIIAMTTTGAARYQQILCDIGPKIVVVEEAAEVLECHVITTLSKRCQHLILIGDHKQLRPSPATYKLARKYHLDLSLFERMINNGIHCDTLSLQHRMRPEISCLLGPIYPHLENHPSVFSYEKVIGIRESVFFINHDRLEDTCLDTFSHLNNFEAIYIVALCEYLLKQGYDPLQIIVLTTYSGQLFKLRSLMSRDVFEGVRTTVVDNFQGEEGQIILLSLVRSNAAESTGFLKIENRVCVALSRAKQGLYVIGNFNLLVKQSPLWKDIVNILQSRNMIGPCLNLCCSNHIDEFTIEAREAADFDKAICRHT